MVESAELCFQNICFTQLQIFPDMLDHIHRSVAQTDELLPSCMAEDCFRIDPAGIGKGNDPGIRTQLFTVMNDIEYDRDRSKCFEHSPGTVCFLTDHVIFDRDPFILVPGVQSSHTELCRYKVGILQCCSAVQCLMHCHIQTSLMEHPLR